MAAPGCNAVEAKLRRCPEPSITRYLSEPEALQMHGIKREAKQPFFPPVVDLGFGVTAALVNNLLAVLCSLTWFAVPHGVPSNPAGTFLFICMILGWACALIDLFRRPHLWVLGESGTRPDWDAAKLSAFLRIQRIGKSYYFPPRQRTGLTLRCSRRHLVHSVWPLIGPKRLSSACPGGVVAALFD